MGSTVRETVLRRQGLVSWMSWACTRAHHCTVQTHASQCCHRSNSRQLPRALNAHCSTQCNTQLIVTPAKSIRQRAKIIDKVVPS